MPTGRIPRWIKLAYAAFVAVLVPSYWRVYGVPNFLQMCDVAAFVTLVGLWAESSLLLSMEAVAILVPQAVWVADFSVRLLGFRGLGLTDYMFRSDQPKWVRGLSLFHGWMPLLLLWAVRRLGYDRRAFRVQTVVGVGVLLACYFCFAPPGTTGGPRPAANVNYVYGPYQNRPQPWMPRPAWLAIVILVAAVGMFLPSHLLLKQIAPVGRVRSPEIPAGSSRPQSGRCRLRIHARG